MAKISAGSAVKYVLLPGIVPRLRELFFSGFGLLAFYIAVIYGKARLLPPSHPYLNPSNIGSFGMRHAIFAAWNTLDFKWRNIDQIILFFAVMTGVVLIYTYLFAAFFFLITAPAMANGFDIFGSRFLSNPYPHDDIAFMMMDRVLGIPGIFDSRVVTTNDFGPSPNAFQSGLHILFAYFSWAMFAVAVMILLYFIVDIVLETTMTGSPFGKHFENIFVPLRLIFAIGLLIPVSYGLNSAQWITLHIAKIGSNFATNGWIEFNKGMENPLGAGNHELVSIPVTPDFSGLAKDIFTIRACSDVTTSLLSNEYRKKVSSHGGIDPASGEAYSERLPFDVYIEPYFVSNDRAFAVLGGRPTGRTWPEDYNYNFINMYLEGLRFYKGQDIKVVFGRYNEANIGRFPGGVEPVCGEIIIPNFLPAGQEIPEDDITSQEINEGVLIGSSHMLAVMRMIYSITKFGYGDEAGGADEREYQALYLATDRFFFQNTAQGQALLQEKNLTCYNDTNDDGWDDFKVDGEYVEFTELGNCRGPINNQFYLNLISDYQRFFSYGPLMGYDYYTGTAADVLTKRCSSMDCSRVVSGAKATCDRIALNCKMTRNGYIDFLPSGSVYYKDLGQQNPFIINPTINSDILKYGWGGAGIWYKHIAEKNGSLTSSTHTLPRLTHYPRLMEVVAEQRAANDQSTPSSGCEKYNPAQSGDKPISLPGSTVGETDLAKLYYDLCKNLQQNEYIKLPGTEAQKTGNPFLDIINAVFGTSHLYSFRENSAVNPMAQMVALGRSLLDKAIQNIMVAAGASAVGGLASMFGSMAGGEAGSAGALASIFGSALSSVTGLIVSTATLGLTAGVLMFYVLPMLPFMYFFFAVATWVKSVFEAMVGMPLWALAHLRMDAGPSFAGKAATGGYFMLLEILLRPTITLIALMATMITFNALAYVLNVTWGLVTNNLVGFDPYTQLSDNKLDVGYWRPRIDQFFFTICYIIFMYMLATSTFKLINLIPDSIMRWIDGMKSFGAADQSEQSVESVVQTVAMPTFFATQSIASKGVDLIYKVPASAGGIMGDIKSMSKPSGPEQ